MSVGLGPDSSGSVCLASRKPRVRSPLLYILGVGVTLCNSGTLEVETEGLRVQSHPQLLREFEDSLGYMKLSILHFLYYFVWKSPYLRPALFSPTVWVWQPS